jgi:acyl carrier protein
VAPVTSSENGTVAKSTGPAVIEDEVSSRLKEVWCEVLQLDSVREDENLFDLGGHSLLVPEMLERIHNKLGVNMKAVELFRFATIRALTGRVKELLSQNQRGGVAGDGVFHEQR